MKTKSMGSLSLIIISIITRIKIIPASKVAGNCCIGRRYSPRLVLHLGTRLKSLILVTGAVIIMIFSLSVFCFAQPQHGYRISNYEVVVKIGNDGNLDVTEKVEYSSLGNSNNAVILIGKQDGEEIEIKKVYTLIRDELIECEQLSAGQWDANVFNGTYSALQENNLVRLKVYGTFKKQLGTFVVHYDVKNSVNRYGDIALFNRNFILEDWNGYTSNIDIEIHLPKHTNTARIKPYLHGVLVGEKRVLDGRTIKYNIPNTVPGEYIETRIVFPENLVKDAQVTDSKNYLETVLQEEKEYSESDKSRLLKARENAAIEADKKAWNEKMKKRTKTLLTIVSFLSSFTGLLTIYRAQKGLKTNQGTAAFGFKDIPQLTPQEAYLLLSGKTGSRGVLAGLFGLASKGFIEPEFNFKENTSSVSFRLTDNQNTVHLDTSERGLLRLVRESSDESGEFILIKNDIEDTSANEKVITKDIYLNFDKNVKSNHSRNNRLTTSQLYCRNLGLIWGVILFAAGCVISVGFSVLSAYLMLPVGLLVFWYSFNIQRRTLYSIERKKALKQLRGLINNLDKKDKALPDWLSNPNRLLGFSIAIGVEDKLHLLADIFEDKKINSIKEALNKALRVLNNSLYDILES